MAQNGLTPFSLPTQVTGQKVTLKQLDLSLAPTLFSYIDQDRTRLGEFLPWVPKIQSLKDEEEFVQFASTSWENHTQFCYGIFDRESEEVMGTISCFHLRWNDSACELGYWLHKNFEGEGFMKDAVTTLETKLFELGFHRLVIRCSPENIRSHKVAESSGYVLDGVMRHDIFRYGKFHDTMIFSKLSTDS